MTAEYITEEEAVRLEMAYGKATAHLKRARAELDELQKANVLNVGWIRPIDPDAERAFLHFTWHRIVRKHPLMAQLVKVAPRKFEDFMWSLGLNEGPPVTRDTIFWAFQQAESRRAEFETIIEGGKAK